MSIDTIQQDVSQVEKQVISSPQMLQREKDMAGIMARSDEELERQLAGAGNVTTETNVRVVDDPAQYRVRVKIDGEEKELSVADVVAGYQKNEVASERLRKASEQRRELDARERAVQQLEAQMKLQSGNLSHSPSGDDQADNGDDAMTQMKAPIARALELFTEGDVEEASNLLAKAMMANKGRENTTPAVDAKQIAQQVRQELDGEHVWETFVNNNPEFRVEFDDQGQQIISREREIGDLIYMRDYDAKVQSGEISYLEALTQTAAAAKRFVTPEIPTQQKISGSEERQSRKAALDNIVVAAGARGAGPVEEKEESRADVIASMRKSRHLPT
ncbi:hypothetical protein UFOVP1419_51 [uncultured Caudovirales phage]|uniref:Uncharacterized protein n=1 Tax=uncultured Caudovirales phage TaxID=2100421 RepID=A0A6J5SDG0_9CAUD|nr:hypothetical protein UFOVP1419_51 [uncultured Caudovirales phage]